MIDLFSVIAGVILGDAIVMGIFVLLLNPKISTQRIKDTILTDRDFIRSVTVAVADVIESEPEKFEGIYGHITEKFRELFENGKMIDMTADRIISKEIREQNPEIQLAIDMISQISPKLGKALRKNPELAPRILEKMKKRGLIPEGSPEETVFDPYS